MIFITKISLLRTLLFSQAQNKRNVYWYLHLNIRWNRRKNAGHRNPSVEQATAAALLTKLRPHTVPHVPLYATSRRPALGGLLSPASLTVTKYTKR